MFPIKHSGEHFRVELWDATADPWMTVKIAWETMMGDPLAAMNEGCHYGDYVDLSEEVFMARHKTVLEYIGFAFKIRSNDVGPMVERNYIKFLLSSKAGVSGSIEEAVVLSTNYNFLRSIPKSPLIKWPQLHKDFCVGIRNVLFEYDELLCCDFETQVSEAFNENP